MISFASSASNSSRVCVTFRYSVATSATTSSNSPSVARWIVYLLVEVTAWRCCSASRKAKCAACSTGVRSITRTLTAE
jgi:hypothetical protein